MFLDFSIAVTITPESILIVSTVPAVSRMNDDYSI
jgi:hypothetical protein